MVEINNIIIITNHANVDIENFEMHNIDNNNICLISVCMGYPVFSNFNHLVRFFVLNVSPAVV